MKKLFALFVMCLWIISVRAQDKTGYAFSGDVIAGYKNKIISTTLGYDFGYKIIPSLYVGIGPMVGASFGDGDSNFEGGGYGKVRFVVPINAELKPFVDARVGYAYSFSESSGDMFYGAGLGIRFAERYSLGIYCNLTYSSTFTYEKYIKGYDRWKDPVSKKYINIPLYGTKEVKHKKSIYTPAILFSVSF